MGTKSHTTEAEVSQNSVFHDSEHILLFRVLFHFTESNAERGALT